MSDSSPPNMNDQSLEDQLRASRQAALLEAMMERKLVNLNREYEECLAAGENVNRADFEVVEVSAEEYGEAWARYQQDCAEELAESSDDFDSDDDGESCAAEPETVPEPEPLHKPLTESKITSIKSVMSGIKLRPPPWALGQPEEVWMAQIMRRSGFLARPTQPPVTPSAVDTQTSQSSQSAPAKAKKKKSKKKKAAKKAAREAKQFEADFEAQFPSTTTDNQQPTENNQPTNQ